MSSIEDCYQRSRSVPSAMSETIDVKITQFGPDGKWASLLKLVIMDIQFEAFMSSASDRSVISSSVYDSIEHKLTGDDRYKLREVTGTRVRDSFGRIMKQLGAVCVPCTILGDCGTKSVTKEITFLVVEGGEIGGVIGAPDFSDDIWNLAFFSKPSRVPLFLEAKNADKKNQSDVVPASTIAGRKDLPTEAFEEIAIPNAVGRSTMVSNEAFSNVIPEAPFINGRPCEASSASPDRIVTMTPMSSEEYPSIIKMKIGNVSFEGLLSVRSGGTILSSRIYDRIVLESDDKTRYKLEEASGIEVYNTNRHQMKLFGVLRVPCTFLSARGTNSVVEQVAFLVVDGDEVDCVFGTPEIFLCKISIILHRYLLVFNNHPSPIPIAMIGAKEDPDVAFKEEGTKYLSIERDMSPVRIINLQISLMTFTGPFPFILKMDIVGVPFESVLSTGSGGTVISAEVYNRIVKKTEDPRYQLKKATNIEVQDAAGKPMKLLGILDAPCKFICAHATNENVIEMMKFLVVENLAADGILGLPEIESLNLRMNFDEENSTLWFLNYKPMIVIGIKRSSVRIFE